MAREAVMANELGHLAARMGEFYSRSIVVGLRRDGCIGTAASG